MEYRNLSPEEISGLEQQGCTSGNWNEIRVCASFDINNISNTVFGGSCRLGKVQKPLLDSKGDEIQGGIYNSVLRNTMVEDGALIRNVHFLANYHVESGVIIENVKELAVKSESGFGNGVEIEVLNEGGGRELQLFDRLSSQLAYLMVIYRHDKALIQALKGAIEKYSKEKKSESGRIGSGSRISNCNTIQNIYIGSDVTINGAQLLQNGSIVGENGTTTLVGSGVIAKDFIIQSGSTVDSGALLEKTFVGQGVKIGKQFSAENSLFFANSEGFHSEAVSVFGGPYTVTHHRSTLLIAGMYSFFNAGSGTNQSNHMYKLGPLHQGIVERGSKTGSFSYMLWPCKVGPYSVVMGKHGGNFDTSDLPFSYLTVENEKTFLTPAMNLITVGTRRDSTKWPSRDRRKGKTKLDLIHFDLLNPYVMNKVLNGIDILTELYEKTPKERDVVNYNGVRIKRLMLKSCKKYYEMALHIFIGDQIIDQIESLNAAVTLEALKKLMKKNNGTEAVAEWVDMAGMVAPRGQLADTISEIKSMKDADVLKIEGMLQLLFENYATYTWDFACQVLEERFEISKENLETEHLKEIVLRWKENSIRLNNMILSDAKKEFDANSKIGFGLGGDDTVKNKDFEEVRGNYDENSFVKGLHEENGAIEARAVDMIKKLEEL
jgi:carbonic anhydrase/acetyltransferase-like protein (isoleucine patch superfamily)